MDYRRISSIADDPSLDIYFKEIGSLAVLTEAQESELALKAKAGNRKALDKLVESNLRFVVSVAKDFQGRGMSMADLINEGNFGLMRAIKRYDPSKGYRFNTYAVWWIRQAILKAIAEQTRSVRLPMNRIDKLNKINKTIHELQAQSPNFGGRPSPRSQNCWGSPPTRFRWMRRQLKARAGPWEIPWKTRLPALLNRC
jgi:RNA polymerase sigma factor (sigma-70 family)